MAVLQHAYRYLHFKVILVQLDSDVCDSFLEEPGRPQHQHQLQVPWKRPLGRSRSILYLWNFLYHT